MPPEFPEEGLKIHSMLSEFHIVLMVFEEKVSIFVSWMKRKWGLWVAMIFRRELFLTLAFSPLIFHETTIIRNNFFDE